MEQHKLGRSRAVIKAWMMKNKVLTIDVDGTLTEYSEVYGQIGKLKPNARRVLQRLRAGGFRLIIESARPKHHTARVRRFLRRNGVPFDDVRCGFKPNAYRFIDDRGIHFTTWNTVLKELKKDFPDV